MWQDMMRYSKEERLALPTSYDYTVIGELSFTEKELRIIASYRNAGCGFDFAPVRSIVETARQRHQMLTRTDY